MAILGGMVGCEDAWSETPLAARANIKQDHCPLIVKPRQVGGGGGICSTLFAQSLHQLWNMLSASSAIGIVQPISSVWNTTPSSPIHPLACHRTRDLRSPLSPSSIAPIPSFHRPNPLIPSFPHPLVPSFLSFGTWSTFALLDFIKVPAPTVFQSRAPRHHWHRRTCVRASQTCWRNSAILWR